MHGVHIACMCFVYVTGKTGTCALYIIKRLFVYMYNRGGVFTARYGLSAYIKQTRFLFKVLIAAHVCVVSTWLLVQGVAGGAQVGCERTNRIGSILQAVVHMVMNFWFRKLPSDGYPECSLSVPQFTLVL